MITAPELLRPEHVTVGFRCGQELLDEWLVNRAVQAARRGTVITFVVCEGERVVGYYSLSAHAIVRADVGGGWLARNTPDPIPAVLLGRLAVDSAYQGRGLGWSLLQHAIGQARSSGLSVGMRALVVDPIDLGATRFYARYGFRPFPALTNRLFLPLAEE